MTQQFHSISILLQLKWGQVELSWKIFAWQLMLLMKVSAFSAQTTVGVHCLVASRKDGFLHSAVNAKMLVLPLQCWTFILPCFFFLYGEKIENHASFYLGGDWRQERGSKLFRSEWNNVWSRISASLLKAHNFQVLQLPFSLHTRNIFFPKRNSKSKDL